MHPLKLVLIPLFFVATMAQQAPPAGPKDGVTKKRSSPRPALHPKPLPETAEGATTVPPSKPIPGFDIHALDTTVSPCTDFYRYACGTWVANNPIPPDRSRWGRFDELEERNNAILRDILEKAAVKKVKRTAIEQKIGEYYASCMDEHEIENKGISPIKPEIEHILALPDKSTLADQVARLHRIGSNVMFIFGSGQDFKNSDQVIGQADQGGLGLPDRDYYLKTDERSVQTRKHYVAHVQKMFELLADPPDKAAARAQVVMTIETGLAKAALDRVSRRDPLKVYHKVPLQQLESTLAPSFGWSKYFTDVEAPPIDSLNVAVRQFFKGLDSLINTTSLDDWKTYLIWHLVHAQVPFLPTAFVSENFQFYGKTLTGAKELRPRWKRCVEYVDADLGEALGQKYVERTFGVEGKERTLAMVREIEKALGKDIQQLSWMTPATKTKALEKLRAVTNKIGYPDRWRDYSSVKIVRGDAIGNSQRATSFEFHRQLAKIGQPVDRGEWLMTPPTVNAYYMPEMNSINFPAGILQPPFFDKTMDDAVNYGAIGAVIGHELTHGFDDEGRKFDAKGNLRDWWTAQDAREFEKRADCVATEYSSFTAVDGIKVNGKLTLGENTADNGGVRVAYMALLDDIAGKAVPKIDGFTPEQRLFLAYGQIWCENQTEESARLSALTNPHAPGKYRVNGVLQNMPEFQKAFGCAIGQPMVRRNPCRVW